MIVLQETTPSFLESCVRSPGTPMSATVFRSTFLVRSALAIHVSPRLYDRHHRLPPSHTMLGLWGDSRNGVFQLKRYASLGPAFSTLGAPPRPPNAPAACCGGVTACSSPPAPGAPVAPATPRPAAAPVA